MKLSFNKILVLLLTLNFIFISSCKNNLSDSESDAVIFHDLNFENLIRETINKPTGKITAIDMLSISILRGYQKNISQINGIEYCTTLKELYLGDNSIEDLSPLSNLTELRNLSLHQNDIVDLNPIINLVKLKSLVLADNKISNIDPLSDLTNLYFIKIGGNSITDIQPLVQNTGIGKGDVINIVDNPLSDTSLDLYIPQLQARGVILYF
jgi:internalin A